MSELRFMKIAEADSELLMRMFLRLRAEEIHENDKRTSKHNDGSRKIHSIESALLENRLIF